RDLLQKDLAKKETAYQEFRQKSPLLNVGKGREGLDVREQGLASIQEKKGALLLRRTDLQSQLSALEAARRQGADRATLLALTHELATRPEPNVIRREPQMVQDQLAPLLAEEQKLLETLGPQHPQVLAVRRKIALTRGLYSNPAAPWRKPEDVTGD